MFGISFFLYTIIGVAIAASAILLGVHQAKTGHPSDAFKWIAFTLNTAFVFGAPLRAMGSWLKKNCGHWRQLSY